MGHLNHPEPRVAGAEGRGVVLHDVLLRLLLRDRRDGDGRWLRDVVQVVMVVLRRRHHHGLLGLLVLLLLLRERMRLRQMGLLRTAGGGCRDAADRSSIFATAHLHYQAHVEAVADARSPFNRSLGTLATEGGAEEEAIAGGQEPAKSWGENIVCASSSSANTYSLNVPSSNFCLVMRQAWEPLQSSRVPPSRRLSLLGWFKVTSQVASARSERASTQDDQERQRSSSSPRQTTQRKSQYNGVLLASNSCKPTKPAHIHCVRTVCCLHIPTHAMVVINYNIEEAVVSQHLEIFPTLININVACHHFIAKIPWSRKGSPPPPPTLAG